VRTDHFRDRTVSAFDEGGQNPGQDRLRAAWAAAGLAARQEWLGDLFAPVCQALPGLSAIVGWRAKEGLQLAWSTSDPTARREFLSGIETKLCGGTAHSRPSNRTKLSDGSFPIGAFLEARTRRVVGARTQATALHEAYLNWVQENGGIGLTPKGLANVLHAHGINSIKRSSMQWQDIELIPSAEIVPDAAVRI
jgi:hypothetical protein